MARQNKFNKSGGFYSVRSHHEMLETETDLSKIMERKTLVLIDEQNLTITAKKLGYTLHYGRLAERIRAVAETAQLHVFIASDQHDHREKKHFKALGYRVHVKTIRCRLLSEGRLHRDCNIDNLFAFWAGLSVLKGGYEVIVLASGDYGLSGDLSGAICAQRKKEETQIMTLSLPGSTAQDLDAHRNKNITANLEIGLDLLGPLPNSACQIPPRTLGKYRKFRSTNLI